MTGQCKLQLLLLTGQKHWRKKLSVRLQHQGEISRFKRYNYEGVYIASVTVTGSETDIVKNDMTEETATVQDCS